MTPEHWRQVEQIYGSALDQQPADRAEFVAQASPNDTIRREVISLLERRDAQELFARPSALERLEASVERPAPGARLGPYEILELIGTGGMGQVYRARDSRLARIVAIKVSKERYSERFGREARAAAALNHPNICTLYDVGPDYLVMELVEGESPTGPLPLDDALAIARQVSSALEAAHEKGIVHRDLKPGNIKIKPDGTVKVLDFGLAKQFAEGLATEGGITGDITLTESGMLVGTAAYMSPEQAQGKAVDKRTDIWAFGLILYELITGRRLFKAETLQETLVAVMTTEPEWDRVPARAQPLLRRCLVRDPSKRLRDIGEAEAWLQVASGPVARDTVPWKFATGALGVIALVAVGLAWRTIRPVVPPLQSLIRVDVDLGPDVSLSSVSNRVIAISPDGTLLAYVSHGGLFVRHLDQSLSRELPAAKGADSPFFSPDNRWVGFFSEGMLKKIQVEGGAATELCDAALYSSANWGDDDKIVANLTFGRLRRIPAAGGTPTDITEIDPRLSENHIQPEVLPGANAILFTVRRANSNAPSIEVFSFADGRRKTLLRDAFAPHYLRSGHLVYLRGGTLYAARFDLNHLEVSGAPVPVLEAANSSLAFSRTGTGIYVSAPQIEQNRTIQWLDAAGNLRPLLAKPAAYFAPHLSPDGEQLAVDVAGNAWVYELKRNTMRQLTFEPQLGIGYPMWTPDGRYILYRTNEGIAWTRSDGVGAPQPLTKSQHLQWPWSFTPDGKRLAFFELTPDQLFDIWIVPVENDDAGLRAGTPERFLNTPSIDERYPSFSPDGRWLAYSSNELGSYQVWVRALSGKGGRWRISTEGGVYPEWSRNGRELFFRGDDNRIMVAPYTVRGDSFVVNTPRAWSEQRPVDVGRFDRNFDLAPDGKRVIALMPAGAPAEAHHVTFLLNFFDEVRRRMESK
jgi:serine/threonine-protein kinase